MTSASRFSATDHGAAAARLAAAAGPLTPLVLVLVLAAPPRLAVAAPQALLPEDAVPFQVRVEEVSSKLAPALQSFAFAESEGRWLMMGGRTNGFHRTSDRESTFPTREANEYLYVVDPVRDALWKAGLPESLRTLLRSTNMEFLQDDEVLYLIGGYGSTCKSDEPSCYQTFPSLTAVRVPGLIQAIIDGKHEEITSHIVSLEDERFRVTGGGLGKLGADFYLVFGQNYDNVYKGAYTGKYTNEVRRFRLQLQENKLTVTDYEAFRDPNASGIDSQYHRRDLNVVEAIRADGHPGLTVYGGVFSRRGSAWPNPVYIERDASGETKVVVDTSFAQKVSLYECAHLLLFAPSTGTMYTTLFGGISDYYYNADGELEPSNLDNWLPFVDSITTLARLRDGTTVESVQPHGQPGSLPALVGANAVFVPRGDLARAAGAHDVLDLDRLPTGGSLLVGHIVGGILATAPQSSEFDPTYASSIIYAVYLER